MDRRTAEIYERHASRWIAARVPRFVDDGRLHAFAQGLRAGARVADLGCGPGWYSALLAEHAAQPIGVVAMDVSNSMLTNVARMAPGAWRAQGDLAALPFHRQSLDAAWAINCYCHLPLAELSWALAQLHGCLSADAPMALTLLDLTRLAPATTDLRRDEIEHCSSDDAFPGRLFSALTAQRVDELLVGAGFEAVHVEPLLDQPWLWVQGRRARTLPDVVRPGLRLLVCGLNPSLYSADAGIPFARPGNRFWPAAVAAGLVERQRDVASAFARGLGFIDLVKRASASAAELSRSEYAAGVQRVERLVRRYQPAATCFVGLDGWRSAVDRKAQPGWIAAGFGGLPAYLMPSTSGRNARVPLSDLAAHLGRAADFSDRA